LQRGARLRQALGQALNQEPPSTNSNNNEEPKGERELDGVAAGVGGGGDSAVANDAPPSALPLPSTLHPLQLQQPAIHRVVTLPPPGIGDPFEVAVDLDLELSQGRREKEGRGDTRRGEGRGDRRSGGNFGPFGLSEDDPLLDPLLCDHSMDDQTLDALLKTVGPSPVSVAFPALAKVCALK
jgi:hypothetical protein